MFKRVRRHTLIIAACLGLGIGCVMALWIACPSGWLLVPWALAAAVSLRRHNVVTVLLLVLCFGWLGWWRGTIVAADVAARQAWQLRTVTIAGVATDEAVYAKNSQQEVVLTRVRLIEPVDLPAAGNVKVRGFGAGMIYRGDTVQATGKLYPTQGNSVATISFAKLVVTHRDTSWINRVRRQFAAAMQSVLPEPHASFALGLLIGQRTTLPEATEQQLRQVGLTHIIAVSGYNLTVIVLCCRRLLAPVSKYQATAACIALIAVFLLVTGTTPPVVRASIISMVTIAAWYYGRAFNPVALLLLAAAATALANPQYVWGNVSWYLSFLAFFGVLVVAPLVAKRLWGDREPRLFEGLLVETLCATVLVLPYVLYIFGQVSLVSIPANLAVVPLIPLAMVLALVAGLAGLLAPVLAGWVAWPARWLLTYMLDVANLLSRLPFAFAEKISFPLPALIASYLVVAVITCILYTKTCRSYKGKNLKAASGI